MERFYGLKKHIHIYLSVQRIVCSCSGGTREPPLMVGPMCGDPSVRRVGTVTRPQHPTCEAVRSSPGRYPATSPRRRPRGWGSNCRTSATSPLETLGASRGQRTQGQYGRSGVNTSWPTDTGLRSKHLATPVTQVMCSSLIAGSTGFKSSGLAWSPWWPWSSSQAPFTCASGQRDRKGIKI